MEPKKGEEMSGRQAVSGRQADRNILTGSKARVLKEAMGQALVCYYAFAGELVGEDRLLCNNRGVNFIEAYADAKLQDLCFYNPDDTIEGKLVPKKHLGVFSVQAKCMYLLLSLANMIFILNQNFISSSF